MPVDRYQLQRTRDIRFPWSWLAFAQQNRNIWQRNIEKSNNGVLYVNKYKVELLYA